MKILEMYTGAKSSYAGSKSEDLKHSAKTEVHTGPSRHTKSHTGSSLPDLILAKLPYLLFGLLLLMWFAAPKVISLFDPTAGAVDPSIWILLLFSLISYLLLLGLSLWLLRIVWNAVGLPEMNTMVSQFYHLDSWQQLKFCFALFALLLLAAVGVLIAVI